jgi:hypothetical protein
LWSQPVTPNRFGPWLQKSQAPKHKETFHATAEGFFFCSCLVLRHLSFVLRIALPSLSGEAKMTPVFWQMTNDQ